MAKKTKKRAVKKGMKKTPTRKTKQPTRKKSVGKKNSKKTTPKQVKKTEGLRRIKVRLIGIGGGGNSIVSEIAQSVRGASFYAANSDVRSLKRLPRKVSKFQFGKELTHGLGTGMDPEIGEAAAIKEKERIREILKGQDFVILVSCLGGGLGSGAAPVFAKMSRDMGNLTYGIFTLPFEFEGEKKMEIARTSLRKVKRRVNAFSVIPNERIFQIIERTAPLNDALSAINKELSASIQSLIEIIYQPGMINIDFADLRTVFSRRGKLTYLNSVKLGKEKEEEDIINRVISSPLYPYSIGGARGVLFNISGKKDLSLAQVNQISGIIAEKAHREARIIFGISNFKKGSHIKVTLLATSCRARGFLRRPKKESTKKPRKKPTKKKRAKKGQAAGRRKKVKSVQTAPQPVRKKKKKKKARKRRSPAKKKRKKSPAKKTEKAKIEVRVKTVGRGSSHGGAAGEEKQRVRKNALQIKKDKEKEEAEIISKEEFWEKPTFLRRKVI